MKTLRLLLLSITCALSMIQMHAQECMSVEDWEDETIGEALQPVAQFGGYFTVSGTPLFTEENCTPGGMVGLAIQAGINGPGSGDVVGYTQSFGINPQPTFLTGMTYQITGRKLYSNATMGSYVDITMTITLVNSMGAVEVVNKSLMLIQGQCESWDPPATFVSPGDFTVAEIGITATAVNGENDLFIIIDDWCIEALPSNCFAEFGYEQVDECGGVQFFSNIDGGTFDSWQISGPNGYTNSSNTENLLIDFPFAGIYVVEIAILCEDGTLQTFQQSITIDFFDEGPIFENCEEGSTTVLEGTLIGGECHAEYTVPDLGPFDDSGVYTLSCFMNGTTAITPGQILTLIDGPFLFSCFIVDECGMESSCVWNVEVQCINDAPCDYICCEGEPNWPVEGYLLGSLPQSNPTGFYPVYGDPQVVADGCDDSTQGVSLFGVTLGFGGDGAGLRNNGSPAIPLFEEGKTYCISYCMKVIGGNTPSAMLTLQATNVAQSNAGCTGSCEPIGQSRLVAQSEGWVTVQNIYTPSIDYDDLILLNNDTGFLDFPSTIIFDNVCITEDPEPITCKVDIIIEEQECGKVIVNTEICGELEEMTIQYDDGFESFQVEDTTVCIDYTSAGPWTVTVNYICAGEMTVRTTSATFTLENKINAPVITCPGDTLINLDPEGECIAEVLLGSYTVDDPSATVQCYVSGILVSDPTMPVTIPVGIAQIEYIATNECGADTCTYEIEVTCETPTDKFDCPIDVLFVLDNSGSISQNEFTDMVASANVEITDLSTKYVNSRFATVHYTGFCGEQLWVENDFVDAGSLIPITRQSSGNDDLNVALGLVDKSLSNIADPDIIGGFLSLDPLAKFYIVIFTDGYKDIGSPTCSNSRLTPYANANLLKSVYGANITVVHFQPGLADDACGAIASPGGNYRGLVDINPGDPDNLTTPRQYIGIPFGAPNIGLCEIIPPCEPCVDCDDLAVSERLEDEEKCCYAIDINNGVGADIVKLEAELVSADWDFNLASTNPGLGFQWTPGTTPSANKMCISDPLGSIPSGVSPDALKYCFSSSVSNPTASQTVIFRWYSQNGEDYQLECTDTIVTNCAGVVDDPCVDVESEVTCNSENAYEYDVTLTITNNSGSTATHASLNNLPPGFQFASCPSGSGTNVIGIPIPGGLPSGSTTSICAKIIASIPVLNPKQICFKVGLYSFMGECCHEPTPVCVILDKCCDPCEDITMTYASIPLPDEEQCCYSFSFDYACDYLFFSKIKFTSVTPGVTFGYHALGNPNFSMCGSTSQELCAEYSGGLLPKGSFSTVMDICMDGIDDASQIPQHIRIDYMSIDGATNEDTVACSDDVFLECGIWNHECLEVSDQVLICLPDSNKYQYTFTIKNTSTIPFKATDATVFVISPADFSFVPSGGIFPFTTPLDTNQSETITACLTSSLGFPSSASEIVLGYRLSYLAGDTCCYESVLDTIAIPPCDTLPSDCFSVVDIEAKNIECDINDCYENPYCQPWVIDVITNAGCFGAANMTLVKGMFNGNPVFVGTQSFFDTDIETIYGCDGEVIQSCNTFMGLPQTCNPNAGITVVTDLTSVLPVWDCSQPIPTYNPSTCLSGPGLSQIDYCIKIMNNSPAGYIANQIILNPLLPVGITVVPSTISQTIASGGMATINFSVRGYLLPTDVVTLQGVLSGFNLDEEEWECADTLFLPVPECPVDECCDSEEDFLADVALGFQIINLGDCTYQVCANQFDTCHWFSNLGPSWGDGSVVLPAVAQSNPPNNCWTHQYTTNGVFKITLNVSEGTSIDEACWGADICGEVIAECCDEDPCDEVDIKMAQMSTTADSCCTLFTIDNNYCSDYYKGIRVEMTAPATVSQISGLNGYVVNQITPQVAEVKPLFGFIGVGVRDAFILCSTDYDTNPHNVTVSWLVPSGDTCVAECPKEFEVACDIDMDDKCFEFVQDSIDCETGTYCFKIKNISSPAFDINSVHMYDLSGSLGLTPSGRITIPTLPSGVTSDWICVNYFGVNPGDVACYKISAHNTPANLPPTTCCTDTIVTCFNIPDCPQEMCGTCPNGEVGGPNMVVNSDFGGGYIGFSSGYTRQDFGLLGANRYAIRNQTNLVNPAWNAIDHTTGLPSGNFLAIDGPSGNIAYSTNVNVVPNTAYVFCMWVDNLVSTNVQSNPVIEVTIGGQVVEAGRLLPRNPDGWQLVTLTYSSGTSNGTVSIDVKDIGGFQYNDWAIDDVSFRACGPTVDLCCDDLDEEAIINFYNNSIVVTNNACEGCVTVDIDSCDLAYVDFGSGEIPMMDLVPICRDDLATGTYTFTIRIERLNANGEVCFEHTFQRSFDIDCPPVDDCCDDLDEDAIIHYYNNSIVVTNNTCEGCVTVDIDSCDLAYVDFGSGEIPMMDLVPTCQDDLATGTYTFTIRIERLNANGEVCFEHTFQRSFDIDCPPVDDCCDVSDADILIYYGTNIINDRDSCDICVTIPIDSCDTFEFRFDSEPFVSYTGTPTLCKTYTTPGPHAYAYRVTRFDMNGDTCYTGTFGTQFDLLCDPDPDPDPCCDDLDEAALDAYYFNNTSFGTGGCAACVIVDLDSCDVGTVTFAGGSAMPINDNTQTCMQYTASGTYSYIIDIVRYDADGDTCYYYQDQQTFDLVCDDTPPVPPCVQIVADSIDCETNTYCFRVKNNTLPGWTIRSLAFVNESAGHTLTPDPISIAPLAVGDTTDWICVTYAAMVGDSVCFNLVAHQEDIAAGEEPQFCCSNPEPVCFVVPDCDMCTMCPDSTIQGPNLVTNSDFEAGYTGFTSDYVQMPTGIMATGTYSIRNSTTLDNGQWTGVDHTTGTALGSFLILNGPDPAIGYRTMVDVKPNTNYVFCVHALNLVNSATNSTPSLTIDVDGVSQLAGVNIPKQGGQWQILTFSYFSGGTSGTIPIEIRDIDPFQFNDWAIDDVSFRECVVEQICCEDEDGFDDLLDIGWMVAVNECSVTISAPQFDSCHWISQSEPDWGDGSVAGQVITSAVGQWTHTYEGPGLYTICATIFEGSSPDDICFTGEMCIDVDLSTCPEPPVPCDVGDLTIYNAITPNGDGRNDQLTIDGGITCRKDIQIFNRWGQMVWSQKDYRNDWEGQSFTGEQLPDGTYFLVVDLPDVLEREDRMRQTYIELRN